MKKFVILYLMLVFAVGIGSAVAQDDIEKYPECFYCGMDRHKFAHSRVFVEYDDGSALGTCSLRCAAVDMALFIDKVPMAMRVGDYNTKKLIDAEKAYWVIGGDQAGVMTKRAKWAFEKEKDAQEFIAAHGGTIATFEHAFEAVYADMYKDNQMIREKRKMKREKMKKKQ